MDMSYWNRVLSNRISRRRGLAALGAGSAAAAFLAACGGDDDDTPAPSTGGSTGGGATGATGGAGVTGGGSTGATGSAASGLVTQPSDTAAQGKAGGTWKHFSRGDATHFDSLVSDTSQVVSISGYLGYAKLLKWKVGRYPDIADGTSTGEHAEEWELSPDKLTLTFKLRQGMQFDDRAPTNGRAADAEDVVWSWNKYIANNPGAKSLAYIPGENTAAPVESVEAPDSSTVIFKMHHPDASLIPLFSAADKFYVFPREADSEFDPRSVIRGAGPWRLEEYTPSVGFKWVKNPTYYVQGRPFPDALDVPIVPDPAQQQAQFRTGDIFSDVMGGFGGFQLDIVPTHEELPETLIYEVPVFPERNIWYMTFGYDGDSPFKDTRMRQAMSMLIDREAYADVIDNRDKFAEQGLELQWEQCTVLGAGWGDYWLDPRDQAKFGENAVYLSHNPEEAKKLIEAAGHPNGVDFDFYWLNDNTFGALYNSIVQLYDAMFREGGLRGDLSKGLPFEQWVNQIVQAYFYNENVAGTRKGYSGAQLMAERPFATPASLISSTLHYLGGAFHGMTPDGNNAHEGDPELNAMSEKIGLEFDRDAQIAMVHDVIRYTTQQSYYIPQGTSAKQFQLIWPVLSGFNAVTSPPNFTNWGDALLDIWLDTTKAPIA
jgi:peptide/nickel transport system substrate-binding protein